MIRDPRTSIALALLALLLLLPAGAAAAERTVSVSATATVQVPNDTAGLGFSVTAERGGRGAALRAVSGRLRSVIAAVQETPGVGDGDVETGRIQVRKTFRGERPVYRASEGISVTLHQPDLAGDLVGRAIAAGATGVRGPRYFVGDTEAAYGKALAAAFDKAQAKAATLAARAGAVLGPALSIEEGGQPEIFEAPQAKGSPTPTSGSSPPPTKPGTSTVSATVGVIFALL